MKNKIGISMIIPTKDRGKDLEELLLSLEQNNISGRSDIEVIIIDNNNNLEKIKEVKDLCSKFKLNYLHESLPGKAFAVNKGILNAKGELLAFTDDDAIIKDSDWLDIMAEKFKKNPKLGYVSGNVIAISKKNEAAKIWEKKGGLSKGSEEKYWSRDFLNKIKFKLFPWPFNKMCAGANCMISKKALLEAGLFNILLENEKMTAGGTLEVGYRIAKNGYEFLYTPDSRVFHKHPKTIQDLHKKMIAYGKGDTAYQMCVFLEHGDLRSLWWSLFGHACYTLSKVAKRLVGKFNFPLSFIFNNLNGNIIGGPLFLQYYLTEGRKLKENYSKYIKSHIND